MREIFTYGSVGGVGGKPRLLPGSGWEPAVHVSGRSSVCGGWLPPLMLIVIAEHYMRWFLLFMSIIGFLVFLWSARSSLTRTTSFELLSTEVAEAQKSHGLSPEGKRLIDSRIEELRQAHLAEVAANGTAVQIAAGGLLALSLGSLGLYLYARRKGS